MIFDMITGNRIQGFFDYLFKAFLVVLMLFEEVRLLLTGVIVLILVDQFTGVFKALYFHEFEWKKFYQLYVKTILYLTVLLATFVYEEYVLDLEFHYFTKALATVIGFQELSSSFLNVTQITGKKFIIEFIEKLKEKFL